MEKNQNHQMDKNQKNQAKKESILNNKSKFSMFHIISIAIIITAGAALIIVNKDRSGSLADDQANRQNIQVKMANLTESGMKEITYELSIFDDGKAKFFQFPNGNIAVKYFIMKSTDGKIRAAFDACDVCWREGKGYSQKGDNMICNNCGNKFPSNKINVITGGCNPATLVITIQNGKINVSRDEILKGAKYFDFAKKG